MSIIEKILYILQVEMEEPKAFGWFHLMWIGFTIVAIIILAKQKNKYSEKQMKIVLGIYGIVALILEITKQLIWSFSYDPTTKVVTWDYQWYIAPFQLCTTPIYVSIICLFLKNSKTRNNLLSYMSFVTILGGITTILLPDSCLVSDILVNIHTMWLHCGSFVVSIYLIMSGAVEINKQNLKGSFVIFLVFAFLAEILNIFVYNIGVLNGETFNMFYISPYFTSTLPVFDVVQENVPFIIFLLIYIWAIFMGATLVYKISYFIKNIISRKQKHISEGNKNEYSKTTKNII